VTDAVTRRRVVKQFRVKARRILNERDPLELGAAAVRGNEYALVVEEAARLLVDDVTDLPRRLSAFIVVRFHIAVGRDTLIALAAELRALWDELASRPRG
jgi:hypothetical protein